jgi:malonate-semialdehyde dehydrogenase (acetylating)/methylmalonate-semialdehyde dehydrogenase
LKAILVGEAQSWLPELVDRAQKLKVNGGFEKGADLFVNDLTSNAIS